MKIKLTDFSPGYKGINLEAWGGIENFLKATSTGAGSGTRSQQLKRILPWLAKAVDMTANAVSELPFDVMKGDTVYDTSKKWENKLSGIPNPKRLIRLIAASLCGGKAYVIPDLLSGAVVDLQYCAPQTITPFMAQGQLKYFYRTTDEQVAGRYYPVDQPEARNGTVPDGYDGNMMYFWLPDPDVELGPAETHPMGTALLSCEVMLNMDATIKTNAENGFIPPTLLAAKGMAGEGEKKKAETFWNSFLRGWDRTVAKIINAEAMDIKRVGSGMDELKGAYGEIYTQMVENIGSSFGIPAAVFMSDKAYASETDPMIRIWYSSGTFVNLYQTIAETMTEQLLDRYGLRLIFRPETLDAFKDDEIQQAGAIKIYTDMGILPSVSFKIVGLEVPEGVTDKDLDRQFEEKQQRADEVMEQMQSGKMPTNPNQPGQFGQKPAQEKPVKTLNMNAEQIKELNLWRQVSTRLYKRSGNKVIDFEVKSLSPDMVDCIRQKLTTATTENDILKAFEINSTEVGMDDGTRALVDAINRATALVEAEMKAHPPEKMQASTLIQLNEEQTKATGEPVEYKFTLPPQKVSPIYLQVPEGLLQQIINVQPATVENINRIEVQPTPVEVKVTNKVDPTPVTINNEVKVPKPETKKPVGAKVKRLPNGDLSIEPSEV